MAGSNYPRHTAAGRTVSNRRPRGISCPSLNLAGRHLVLVDDVLTSGATVYAYTRTLLRAGAAQVDVLVFARVVAPARSPI
jgi:predicted amidophosphoribosyltransferase